MAVDPRSVSALLRELPGVDTLLASKALGGALRRWGRRLVVLCLREEIDAARQRVLAGDDRFRPGDVDWVTAVERRAAAARRPRPQPVINATGVPIHTNLGRVPLAEAARAALERVASGYCDLEYDLEAGRRGSRHHHVVDLLRELTGAEDALVVNNNAAAVLLATAGLAAGGEVVVSRGELVEIGGSFRIPDVIRQGGARLVEVGTTNRTHLRDYEAAVGADTRMLLKVHRSNFTLSGFTAEVPAAELATLALQRGLLSVQDLGSGCLVRLEGPGLTGEPTVPQAVAAGPDVVTFSGDKLIGGPQAGVLVGRRQAIARLRTHPLLRALRPDKLTLAALGATLELVREGRAQESIPVLRMLLASAQDLRQRAERFTDALTQRWSADGGTSGQLRVELRDHEAPAGGGALPGRLRPVTLILLAAGRQAGSATEQHARLRHQTPPVVARVVDERLALDLRCVAPAEESHLAAALVAALGSPAEQAPRR